MEGKQKYYLKTKLFKRKSLGKTNFRKRLSMLKSESTRLVIRVYSKTILAQLVNYENSNDVVLTTVKSTDLKKYGWNHNTSNLSASYLTGVLIAKIAKDKKLKITENIIVDLGLVKYKIKTKPYALIKGAIDNGLNVLASEEAFPDMKRIEGNHILEYSKISSDINKIQFSKIKNTSNIMDDFKKVLSELKK